MHVLMLFVGDCVYMEENDWRKEYVLNETGRIWQGSSRYNFGKPWNCGQVWLKAMHLVLIITES